LDFDKLSDGFRGSQQGSVVRDIDRMQGLTVQAERINGNEQHNRQ
jgi:hypothetical protein